MGIVEEIHDVSEALQKLRTAAQLGKSCTLTPWETRVIANRIEWLADERDKLLSELPED